MGKTVFRVLAVLLLLLLAAVLVPSSTPISIGTYHTLGPFRISNYGLMITAGVFLAALVSFLLGKRRKLQSSIVAGGFLSGMAGALLGARLVYSVVTIESILVDYGLAFIPRLWEGGYTLFGGLAGGIAGIALYARIKKQKLPALLDLLAPGAALFLAAARIAEFFNGQGLGFYILDEALQWFPFAVEDAYGYWMASVFVYEALAALAIAVICAALLVRGKPGRTAVWFLTLLSLSQILFDSWRHDGYLRFGFVHFNQLAGVATLAVLLAMSVARQVKETGWTLWQIARGIALPALIGVLIWVEYALDKLNVNNVVLYLIMAAALAAMGFAVLYEGGDRNSGGAHKKRTSGV